MFNINLFEIGKSNRLCAAALLTGTLGLLAGFAATAAPGVAPPSAKIAIPGGTHGVDFDDLQYFPAIDRVAIPAAQTGDLDLINPKDNAVTVIADVAAKTAAPGSDDRGATSAAYGDGYIFTGDHGSAGIVIIAAHSRHFVGRAKLAANYDYIRFLPQRQELWVTEPHAHRIEIFKFAHTTKPALKHEAFIDIPGGPEALQVDAARDRAYTNLWSDHTLAISLSKRRIVARWPNGCRGSRGLALTGHWLFVGCKEGRAVTLDVSHNGKHVSAAATGAGVDIIAYNPHLHHLYVPGAKSETLTVLNVTAAGRLRPDAVYRAAKGSHCVTTDDHSKAYVCDPEHGQILVIDDR
ncbi:MAG TPA: hypothetical protein VFL54_07200 [Gammaproteobacteria bacterium]|nr:hypothetical protein [Gammaproteobacteria bacterium]